MTVKSIHLNASMKHWDEFMEFIDNLSEIEAFSSVKSYRFKLAAEELLSNIVRSSESAFQSTNLMATLRIDSEVLNLSGKHILQVVLIDDAPQFDPKFDQLQPPEHIDDPVALRPIGGLGLYLVKDSVDSIVYKYSDSRNIYTLQMELDDPLG